MKSSLMQICQHMDNEACLAELLNNARGHRELLDRIRECMPGDLARQCVAALAKGDGVILFVSSPVWASRLRFVVPAALSRMGKSGSLRVRVMPKGGFDLTDLTSRLPVPRLISCKTADLLRATANRVSDPELGNALRRLAKHES